MDKIAQQLKAYIDTHPFDPGDSDCATVLDQLYQAYAESHESDPSEISEGTGRAFPWRITTPYSTFAVGYAAHTNAKPLSMDCNMVHS